MDNKTRSTYALAQRLGAVAEVLLPERTREVDEADPAATANYLFTELMAAIHARPKADEVWLLFAGIAGCLPESYEVHDAVRAIELMSLDEAGIWLLDRCLSAAIEFGEPEAHVRIVRGGVVIDVSHSAQSILHTGIQQVVRSTVPRWLGHHEIVPVAWGEGTGALRVLTDPEWARVMEWGQHTDPDDDERLHGADSVLVIPWHSVVVLPEVPATEACRRLAAMAEHGTNRIVAIGYDCIPVLSAGMMLLEEPSRFVHFLTVIKYAARVAGISSAAAAEFAGFTSALPTQGLVGPEVTVCALPSEQVKANPQPTRPAGRRPLVLCVGSHEPRKNHLAVLYAAETLWREGLDFELLLIGGSGFGSRLGDRADRLAELGRPIRIVRKASDSELAAAYQRARFTMFPSLHEGYGLPVAESLASRTPVITATFGSMAEQIRDGGGLAVDTRDDEAITAAMRSLLTDDDLLERLCAEAAARPRRSWDDYAGELWDDVIAPELKNCVDL